MYSINSDGSEGFAAVEKEILTLMYSMISHGSEGECLCLMFTKERCSTVHFSMVVKMLYSHGSEGFYYLRFLILKNGSKFYKITMDW